MGYLKRRSGFYAYTDSAPLPMPGSSPSASHLPTEYSHSVVGTQQAGSIPPASAAHTNTSVPAGAMPHPILTPSGGAASSNAPAAFNPSTLQKIPYVPNIFATTNSNANAASPDVSHTVITAPGGAASSGLVIARAPTQTSTVSQAMDQSADTTAPIVSTDASGNVSTTTSDGSTVTQAPDGTVTVTAPKSFILPAGLGLLGLFLLFRH